MSYQQLGAPIAGGWPHGGNQLWQEDETNLREAVSILWRRRWLFLAVLLLVLGTLLGILFTMTPQYQASAVVLMKAQTPQIVNLEPVVANATPNPLSLQSDLESEIELIRSQRNLEPVFERFKVMQDPEFNVALRPSELEQATLDVVRGWLRDARAAMGLALTPAADPEDDRTATVDEFLGRLSLTGRGRSRAIEIGFTSEDPAKAAAIATAVADGYVDLTLRERTEVTRQALDSVTDRLEQLRRQVTASETAVEDYRIAHNLVDGDSGSVSARRVADLNNRLVATQSERAAAAARLDRMLRAAAGPEAAPEVLASETIQKLREQETLMLGRLAEVKANFGPLHPQVTETAIGLRDLRAKLQVEVNKIVASLRTQVESAALSEANIRALLKEAESDAGQRNLADVRLRELQREATADRTLYELFLGRVQQINQQIGLQQPDAQVITRAQPPTRPAKPSTSLFGAGAVLLSLVAGVMAVVVAELLSGGFKSLRNIEGAFGLPTLALLPRAGRRRRDRQHIQAGLLDRPRSAFAAAIGGLRTSVQAMTQPEAKVVLFTSSVGGEGKTTAAVAFARLSARAGQKVILIDGDLWNSGMPRLFGWAPRGLTDVLHGICEVEEVIRRDERSELRILPAASRPSNAPSDLLADERMGQLVGELRQRYDLVVIDAPPTLPVPDARVLARQAERVIYVVRWRSTPKRLVRMGLDQLAQSGVSVLGMVYSQVDPQLTSRYGFNYVSRGSR